MAWEWRERHDRSGSWLFFSRGDQRTLAAFVPADGAPTQLVSLGWFSKLDYGSVEKLQVICWSAFHCSVPGYQKMIPQGFRAMPRGIRVARPIDRHHQVREEDLPAAVSDAVPSVMRALSEGEPPEPPIFRVEFLADLARDEPSSQPAWTANWGRRYPDVEKVAELPYGNVGLMLSRQAVEEFEDDLAQMITRDSLVQCELEDTRGALRHIADHFRTDPSMGGPAAPSGGGATVASSGSAAGN